MTNTFCKEIANGRLAMMAIIGVLSASTSSAPCRSRCSRLHHCRLTWTTWPPPWQSSDLKEARSSSAREHVSGRPSPVHELAPRTRTCQGDLAPRPLILQPVGMKPRPFTYLPYFSAY
eukprot:5599328-Heterocapsa_arctica.AAC.1